MNKKLIAMAVGSALGAMMAPSIALAQSSSVTLSGRLNFYYGQIDNGGGPGAGALASKLRTDSLINSESEWVLSGQEALGSGLSAFFRCATTMDITGGTAANMCGRTSYIGLKGNFGAISFGNNDTPTKRMMANFDPFPISATMGQGWQMWNGTANNATNTVGNNQSFARRQANLITYDMPTMSGFDAAFAYSSTNEASAQTSASTIQKPRLWAAMVQYSNGPLMLGAGYERHIDYNPGAVATYRGGNDSSWQFGAAYKVIPNLRLSAIYNRLSYDNIDGLGRDMSVNTWGAYADWNISGPHTLRAGYGNQANTKGSYAGAVGVMTANAGAGASGAQRYTLEYAYALSKRTELSAAYATIRNDTNSAIIIGTGAATPNAGQNQSYAGVRIDHKF